jgi:hypothetical protein
MTARTTPIAIAAALTGLLLGIAHAHATDAYPLAATGASVCDSGCSDASCDAQWGAGSGGRWLSLDRLGVRKHHPHCGCFRCQPRPAWASFDALLWWGQGRSVPALVSNGTLPTADVLFGGGDVGNGLATGARADFGFWFDECETLGMGAKVWGLEGNRQTFFANSPNGDTVLAIPYMDVLQNPAAPNAFLVASPGELAGNVQVATGSSVLSTEAYLRTSMFSGRGYDLDLIGGYHFVRLDDDLRLDTNSVVIDPFGASELGTLIQVRDLFDARNEFHGGNVGLVGEIRKGCWTLTGLAKLSVGNMRQSVSINGSQTFTTPPPDPTVAQWPGGIFSGAQTNMGSFGRDVTAWIPEIGITAAYQVRPWMRLTMGYSAIWFSSVVFSGDHIDTYVNRTQWNGGMLIGEPRPAFAFQDTDYWLHGLNLGVTLTF